MKIRGTIAFWACQIMVNINLLESKINPLFTIFWIVMSAYFAWFAWEEGEEK